LPRARRELELLERGASLGRQQRTRPRRAVVEQQRVDPLLPSGALVDERLAQPHPLAQLEDLLRRRPRLRQPTLL
jgi:hypothetical protein